MRKDKTEIIIVLDRSGSMGKIRTDTIHGVNTFIADQRKLPGECLVTLATFDDQYDVVCSGIPIQVVKPLDEMSYAPRGWTALHGAIGRTIEDAGSRLNNTPEHERPEKVVFLIVTDGEENSSHKYEWSSQWNQQRVKQLIEQQSGVYKWQFVFIGANQDAVMNGEHLGIQAANSLSYTANAIGTESLYKSASANLKSFRSGQSASMAWSDDQREAQANADK